MLRAWRVNFLGIDMGMWKDRSADGQVSTKKPRKVKEREKEEETARQLGAKREGREGMLHGGEDDESAEA